MQTDWPFSHDDCPTVDIHGLQEVFVANYLSVDLLGEERQPVGSQLAEAEGRNSLRGGLLSHFLHWGHVGLLAGQLFLLLGLQWTVERQTTRMEVCFLFACRHVACLPQLHEEHQMPGGSVSLLDYSPWLLVTNQTWRETKDLDDLQCHVTNSRRHPGRQQIFKEGK